MSDITFENITFEQGRWYIDGDGSRLPNDGHFTLSHSEWARLKAAIDALYAEADEAAIVEENYQKWLRSPLAPQDQRIKENKPLPPRRERPKFAGYIYLIHAMGTDLYKIGQSRVPERRLLNLGKLIPFPLALKAAIPTDDMDGSERYWHGSFAKERAHGEWFLLSRAQVARFIQVAEEFADE